jgi:hypothetical protein
LDPIDPNANLKEQRELAWCMLEELERGRHEIPDVYRLCELVQAMDHWLSGGGFLPTAWEKHL